MATTYLLLIRHGTTDWIGKRLPGWLPDIHLNAEGRLQAQSLGRRLASVGVAAIYSSPLERALETAEALARESGLSVEPRQGLIEANCGEWTGRSIEELKNDDVWKAMRLCPGVLRFPGGESLREVQARMVAELESIREGHPGVPIAVVSHADPIRVAAAFYSGIPLDLYQRLAIDPASVTVIAMTSVGPRLLCLNHGETLPPLELEGRSGKRE